MDEANPNSLYDPTQDERTYATLAHALQMAGTFIAPLVILVAKSGSKFVKFHALQALLLQICTFLLMFLFMFGMMATMFASIPAQIQQEQASQADCDHPASSAPAPCDENGSSQPAPAHKRTVQPPFPTAFFVLFPLFWLGYMGWWITMIVLTVMYSLKAGRGEWKGYPVLGRLAARFLGIKLAY